jgi:WD repeat-containing protein 68
MRSPGHPVAELVGHQGPLNAIAWGSGGIGTGETGGGWLASCSAYPFSPCFTTRTDSAGDDAQLLLYDMTAPLPSTSRPPSTAPTNSSKPSGKSHLKASQSQSHTILSPSASPNFQTERDSATLLPASARADGARSRLGGGSGDDAMEGRDQGGADGSSTAAAAAVEIMPSRAWSAESGINNLAFDREGEWLGCVSGSNLSVLRV